MTINIGLLFSITGTMAVTEEGQYKAALLAINEINASGGIMGKKLIPILRDIGSDPQIAADEAENLISQGVNLIVGLYTSASRKRILPVLDKYESLLFYPTQYEGGELHPNIMYCGPLPNQILLDYIPWIIKNLGAKIHLIGSDYIYPREMNKLINILVAANGGEVVGESYFSLGEKKFQNEIHYLKNQRPDVIFSTLVGESAVSFYKEQFNANLQIPIASTITAETEIGALNRKYMAGHYSCFPYFNSIESMENKRFKKKFKEAYGTDVISSAMENAYNSVHLLAIAINAAQSIDTQLIKKKLSGLKFQAPQGEILVDQDNQHLWLHSRIGQVGTDGRFKIIWESKTPIKPSPFSLGMDHNSVSDKNLEEAMSKNSALIHQLKTAAEFFPHMLAFFHSDGILLDLFSPSLKFKFKNEKLEPGISAWTSSLLKNSAITKALRKREVSFTVGSDHHIACLADWITVGIPIEHNGKVYGVLGAFIHNFSDFNIDHFSTIISALITVTKCSIDILENSKERIFLLEIVNDISNHLDEALIVKKKEKILFKNKKAEQLINEKNDVMQNIYRKSFDHITYTEKKKYSHQMKVDYEITFVPVDEYRYIYLKENKANQRISSIPQKKGPLLFKNIVGNNPLFLKAIDHAKIAAKNSANVLILGESGTGKEVFARAIHNESLRKDKPFVAINCAAMNESLIASELFGYVEGAFTGAKKGGSPGKFEQVNGGTLFLDEIGDMQPDLQATLLRVLQEKEITRVGGNKTIPIDVRIIAATNKNLSQEIAYNGTFRGDLYYRLNVFTIELISLKDRVDDIPELAKHFLIEFAMNESGIIKKISNEALYCLKNYHWPGNIRELRNIIERSYYISDFSEEIMVEHLPRFLYSPSKTEYRSILSKEISILDDIKKMNIEQEKEDIVTTLIKYKGNISKSSQHLGISRNTLYKKIKEYNLSY